MSNTRRANAAWHLLLVLLLAVPLHGLAGTTNPSETPMVSSTDKAAPLSARQEALVPVAAFAAAGQMAQLNGALEQGMDAGVTISEVREVLVQLYAYAGFPRSLNALSEFMQVLEARQRRGIFDAPGREPVEEIPTGIALLEAGTANQTQLVGSPVTGALFEFAPAADLYLKTHLFGDIFERDNLAWSDREIATIAMLAALSGTDAQLQAHMSMGINAGLTPLQLHLLTQVLEARVGAEPGRRALAALATALPAEALH